MKELDDMQLSVNCLALEVPEAVHVDVRRRWAALKAAVEKLTSTNTLSTPCCCPLGPNDKTLLISSSCRQHGYMVTGAQRT